MLVYKVIKRIIYNIKLEEDFLYFVLRARKRVILFYLESGLLVRFFKGNIIQDKNMRILLYRKRDKAYLSFLKNSPSIIGLLVLKK